MLHDVHFAVAPERGGDRLPLVADLRHAVHVHAARDARDVGKPRPGPSQLIEEELDLTIIDRASKGDEESGARLEVLVGDRSRDARPLGEGRKRERVRPFVTHDRPRDLEQLLAALGLREPPLPPAPALRVLLAFT